MWVAERDNCCREHGSRRSKQLGAIVGQWVVSVAQCLNVPPKYPSPQKGSGFSHSPLLRYNATLHARLRRVLKASSFAAR